MSTPCPTALRTRLFQRHIPDTANQAGTPTLLLVQAMASSCRNQELIKGIIRLLPGDTTSADKLEQVCKSIYRFELYQIALIRCVKALAQADSCDRRHRELLAKHTRELLAKLENETYGCTLKQHYWDLASSALQILPDWEESTTLSALQQVAKKSIWPPDLSPALREILLPSHEQIAQKIEALMTLQQYEACVDYIRHLPHPDFHLIASSAASLFNADASKQAALLSCVLVRSYTLNSKAATADLHNWQISQSYAKAFQGPNAPQSLIYPLCKVCASAPTHARVSQYITTLNLEMALKACSPFPPAISLVVEHLLDQSTPDRAHLIQVLEYLIELRSIWFDERLRNNTVRLIRYFADHPFDNRDQEVPPTLLLRFVISLPIHSQVLHHALDALSIPKESQTHFEDLDAYHTILIWLNQQLLKGMPPREAVAIWQRLRVRIHSQHSSTPLYVWEAHHSSTLHSLIQATVELSCQETLPPTWWPILLTSAHALLMGDHLERVTEKEKNQMFNLIQQLLIRCARLPSDYNLDSYFPLLTTVLQQDKLTQLGYDPVEWMRPIAIEIAHQSGAWHWNGLLGVLERSPVNLADALIPDIIEASLKSEKQRIILKCLTRQYPFSSLSPAFAKQIFQHIEESSSFTENLQLVWGAYYLLHFSQNDLPPGEYKTLQLYWLERLIRSGSSDAWAMGMAIYRALYEFACDTKDPMDIKLELELLPSFGLVPANALEQAETLMQRNTHLGRLAKASRTRTLALGLYSLHRRSGNRIATPSKPLYKKIHTDCAILRHQTPIEESLTRSWIHTIDWIVYSFSLSHCEMPNIRHYLDNALELAEGTSARCVPEIDRGILGYRILEALFTTSQLSSEERTTLLRRVMQPKVKKLLFRHYPDLMFSGFLLAFDSLFENCSSTTYEMVTQEYFPLLVGVPNSVRKRSLTAWLKWSVRVTEKESILSRIDEERNRNTLSKSEHRTLVDVLRA